MGLSPILSANADVLKRSYGLAELLCEEVLASPPFRGDGRGVK